MVRTRRLLTIAPLLACAAAIAGCSTIDRLVSPAERDRLPGERVSVMQLEQALEADPRLADAEVLLPPPYINEEWPQPGGFASHAMYHLEAPGPLTEIWSVSAGEGSSGSARLTASPVIGEGTVFAIDTTGTVHAFDAATGAERWTRSLAPLDRPDEEGGFGGGVAYDGGNLYATSGFGEVVALDAGTGSFLWRFDAGIAIRNAPTVAAGRVFVITTENRLIVLAAADGRELWDHQAIAEQAGILASTSVAVAGEVAVAPFSSGEIVAFRIENGRQIWSDAFAPTGAMTGLTSLNDIAGRPVIDRGFVYAISHSGRFGAVDLRSGERVWTRNAGGIQMPWAAGDYIYVVTLNGEVLCVSRRDGRVRWVTRLPAFEDEDTRANPITWSGPVLVSDRLILASSDGYAVALSPYDGRPLGQIELPDGVFIAPVVAGGTVFVLTDDAELIALR